MKDTRDKWGNRKDSRLRAFHTRMGTFPINTCAASAAHLPEVPNPKSEIRFSHFSRVPFGNQPHLCLEGIEQDDDLRRPKAVDWSGSPWGELAAKQTEGGGMRNGGWELQWKTEIIDSSNRFCPLTPSGSSPEGEHLLNGIVTCPGYVSLVSLICGTIG